MTDIQILMKAPMVLATLDDSKDQTRRVMKPQPTRVDDSTILQWKCGLFQPELLPTNSLLLQHCPYGQPVDRLWVRETWMPDPPRDGTWPHVAFDGCRPRDMSLIPERYRKPEYCLYRADGNVNLTGWTPAIHMFRWASRITLEVTGVRIERLQAISEADAIAEGIERSYDGWRDYRTDPAINYPNTLNPIESYRTLWESINGEGSWDENPWVWVVNFKRINHG